MHDRSKIEQGCNSMCSSAGRILAYAGILTTLLQSQLERTLFSIMEEAGFGDEYVKRYKMVSSFFRQRRPLIVQLCGAPCTGELLLSSLVKTLQCGTDVLGKQKSVHGLFNA